MRVTPDFDSLAGLFDTADAVYRLPRGEYATVQNSGNVWHIERLAYEHDEMTGASAWQPITFVTRGTLRLVALHLRALGAHRVRSVYDVR